MTTKYRQIDYSKLTVPEIIRRVLKKNVPLSELVSTEIRKVLDYIQKHEIRVKVFTSKWFDVLSNKFFAVECVVDEEYAWSSRRVIREFATFKDFYDYIDGDIYENSCFYGYSFSQQEINQFRIDFASLNTSAFISEDITSYSYSKLALQNKNRKATQIDRLRKVAIWMKECDPITSLETLEQRLKSFERKFRFHGSTEVFISLIIQKYQATIEKPILEYFLKKPLFSGLHFGDILEAFGWDAAVWVIENYRRGFNERIQQLDIKEFTRILKNFNNEDCSEKLETGFDNNVQFYYSKRSVITDGQVLFSTKRYFTSLDDLASAVGGNFKGGNFLKAPADKGSLLKFTTDFSTRFPPLPEEPLYQIKKEGRNGDFTVEQIWQDSQGTLVLDDHHRFNHFFDFVFFLRGDLSGADLLMCDGIERLKGLSGLILKNAKLRSNVSEVLGLPIAALPASFFEPKELDITKKRELVIANDSLECREDQYDADGNVSYITDIHLPNRIEENKCVTSFDREFCIRKIAHRLGQQATETNLIGGDTTYDFDDYVTFMRALDIEARHRWFFVVLGNHELWPFIEKPLDEIVSLYKEVLPKDMFLVHNNLYYYDRRIREIPTIQLQNFSIDELRKKLRAAEYIIFGGIGFAGCNEDFNANHAVYGPTIDRAEELRQTKLFYELYKKVCEAAKGKNVIILTHMPIQDWAGSTPPEKGFTYVNGHNHHNSYYEENGTRIFADNQIGYRQKQVSFKRIYSKTGFDWFQDYEDGIFEITRDDYETFYRGIGAEMSFNREFKKLYLIKRQGNYMFLMERHKGTLLILNGGMIKNANGRPLSYFYEHLPNYSESIKMFLANYEAFQQSVAKSIKEIGGSGRIHGSIIDIDFYNHLYLNPLDRSITAYFAYSMVDKYVYENLPSLLKFQCPELFQNYQSLIKSGGKQTLVALDANLTISENSTPVEDTSMYRVSRILRGLQYTTKNNLVRLWNDEIAEKPSEKGGRLIVTDLIKQGN